MLKLFRKNQKNVNEKPIDKIPVFKKPVNKQYTEEELFQALEEDGIAITEQDIQKARENDPETLHEIGDAYYEKKNHKKAFGWYYKAALQGHADSQAQLGEMYREGWGVSTDYKQAMYWSMKAASTGNANAQFNIGDLYRYGRGVSEDDKQAMDWYLKAANNGNTQAMNRISWMYQDGEGVTKNIPTAIEWYTKAANQGDPAAQYNLGRIYGKDDRFQDPQKAVYWYQKALDNGHSSAKNGVKKLNERGHYAKEEEQENETIQDNNAPDIINNNQSQPSLSSNNEEHLNNSIENRMENLEKMFQSKMSLMEVNTDTLQKELAALKQKELQQHEENMKLRDELAKLKAIKEDSTNNSLNYNSSNNANDNEDDRNNATVNKTIMEENNDALQKELTALEQTQIEQHEGNNQLSDELTMLNAGIKDIVNNDLSNNSSDSKHDSDNDINYDSESTNSEAEEGANKDDNTAPKHKENKLPEKEPVKTEPVIQGNVNNNPYYDSSDNDNANDFNYDTECSDDEEEEDEDNTIAKRNAEEVKNDKLQKELASLKQKELEQDEENRLLKEKLARIKAGLEDEAYNDPNCYSSDDESDKNNDINYESECSEEGAMANTHQTRDGLKWFETPGDPNYDSSDNEDPRSGV